MITPKFFRFPFAASGDKETIPDEAQSSGQISYSEGFGLDYERDPTKDAKAKRMPRDGTNQVLYDATSNLQQYQLYGAPFWYDASHNGDTAIQYQKNAIVRYAANDVESIYISLKDNNTDAPNVETSWFLFAPYDATLLSRLSVAPFVPVESMTLTTPPSTPTTNKLYLVPNNATGTWANKNGQLAEWNGKKWTFASTNEGHTIGLSDGRLFTKVNGTYVEKIAQDMQSGKWNYAVASGTANALTATLNPIPQSLTEGMVVFLKVKSNNTGAATLNLSGLGTQPICSFYGTPLTGDELLENTIVELVYSKQNGWMLTSPTKATGFGYGQAFYSTPGQINWVVPEGVTLIEAEIWGGGGGAGGVGTYNVCSGGGGSGAYVRKRIKVIPGTILSGVVGIGGARGNYGGKGGTGGTTSFASMITATGGGGGNPNPAGDGGGGGGASGGDINANGCSASAGGSGSGATGGAGASAPFGGGGGGGGQGIGGPGSMPGGGGGGCGGGGGQNLGGAGASGAIFIKW